MYEAMLEKLDTTSEFVVEPTLIAEDIQAGAAIPLVDPLLADAITVAISTERS